MNIPYLLDPPIQISFSWFSENETELTNKLLKKILYWYGPVIVSLYAHNIQNNQYKGDIIEGSVLKPKDKSSNHIFLIVGYGYDKETQRQFWICKNSWSSAFGNQGYLAVYFGDTPYDVFYDFAFIDNYQVLQMDLTVFEDPSLEDKTSPIDFMEENNQFKTRIPVTHKGNYATGFHSLFALPEKKPGLIAELAPVQYFERLGEIPDFLSHYMTYTCGANRFGTAFNGPVRNQDQCESCWIFAPVEALSIGLAMKYFTLTKKQRFIPISTQHFINQIPNLYVGTTPVMDLMYPNNELINPKQAPCQQLGNVPLFLGMANGLFPITPTETINTTNKTPVGSVPEQLLPFQDQDPFNPGPTDPPSLIPLKPSDRLNQLLKASLPLGVEDNITTNTPEVVPISSGHGADKSRKVILYSVLGGLILLAILIFLILYSVKIVKRR